ncbi:MAG: electron transport complex subunit RsxE, partial [Desulfovibrionaceae bacterium]
TFLGSLRELLGAGTLFGAQVTADWFQPFGFMVEAPGAFVGLGLVLGGMNAFTNWQRRRQGKPAIDGPTHDCKTCGMCQGLGGK